MGFLRGLGKFKFPIMLGIGFILAELVVTFAGCEVWLNINEELLCAGDGLEFRSGSKAITGAVWNMVFGILIWYSCPENASFVADPTVAWF